MLDAKHAMVPERGIISSSPASICPAILISFRPSYYSKGGGWGREGGGRYSILLLTYNSGYSSRRHHSATKALRSRIKPKLSPIYNVIIAGREIFPRGEPRAIHEGLSPLYTYLHLAFPYGSLPFPWLKMAPRHRPILLLALPVGRITQRLIILTEMCYVWRRAMNQCCYAICV